MSAQNPEPKSGDSLVEGPHDPEHNPAATYALEPDYVEALTGMIRSTSGESKASVSPINLQPLGAIPQSSDEDVAEAFARARTAQGAWARTSIDERADALLRLHDLLLDRADEITDLIVWESGKARKHAFDEVYHVALTARYYARTAHRHLDTERRGGVIPGLTRVDTVPNTLILRGDGVKIGGEGLSLGNLNMTLGGDVRATKSPGGSAMVVGTVNTVRGFYEFQGRRFELRRDGTVSFKGPDPTNPQLDVTATRDVSGVEARVRVHGEAQRPELELSSTPPLDEGDILSLIIFNRPINDLGEGEKTTLAQRAGSLVGGFVAAPVAEALRDALDVDLLEITPVSDEGGASVSVGNQIGERVFVKVRQQFGSSEATQLVLEYELSDLLRLETSVAQGGDTSRTIGRRAERGGADLVFVVKY